MATIEIQSIMGDLLFSAECASMREALEKAARDRAKLSGAKLSGAKLSGANLSGADLYGAIGAGDWMKVIADDLRKVLDAAPNEVPGLLAALWAGKVDGSKYDGECACLVGTVANLRSERYDNLKIDLRPDSSRPSERWFLQIHKGDTPLTNQAAAYAAAIIAHWQWERAAKPAKKSRKAAVVQP